MPRDARGSSPLASRTPRVLRDRFEHLLVRDRLECDFLGLINRDFENQTVTPGELQALSAMVANGQLGLETMWAQLRETLPAGFDPEIERDRIASDVGGFTAAVPYEAA